MPQDARSVVLGYLKAFEAKDKARVASYLHPQGFFKGPTNSFNTAESFLQELSTFMQITKSVKIRKVLSDDTDVCVFWDYETTIPSMPEMPIAEWYRTENGKIREMYVHFNPMPFIEAMQKGEMAQALNPTQ